MNEVMRCPKCGREIPFSLTNEQGVSHCPFCGTQLYRLTESQSRRTSSKNWQGVGLVSLAVFFISFFSAWFAWKYSETISLGIGQITRYPYQQYVFPLSILAALSLVIAFIAAEMSSSLGHRYNTRQVMPAPPPPPNASAYGGVVVEYTHERPSRDRCRMCGAQLNERDTHCRKCGTVVSSD